MSYVGLHLDDIKATALIISFILALRNIYQLFLRVPLGQFSQMVGRKPLLITGVGCYSISLFIMSLATHWGFVFLAITFVAIGMSCFWPILFAYIGDVEKKNIGQLQGRVFQGTDLGTILGGLLAFSLLRVSRETFSTVLTLNLQNLLVPTERILSMSPLRVLFAWGAGISSVGVIGMAFFMPEVLKPEDKVQVDSKRKALAHEFLTMFSNLVKLTKQKKLSFIYIVQLFIAFLEYMVTAFFPFLVVSKGFTDDVVAQIAWITAGSLIFFKPYLGKIVDKISYKIPIFVTLLFSSTMLILMVFINSLPGLIVVYILYSASSLTSYIGVNTGTTIESRISERGIALGALGFYVSFARSVSTLGMTPVWENFGINAVFITTACIVAIAVIIIYAIYMNNGNKRKKEEIRN
jgi:MFS family permease